MKAIEAIGGSRPLEAEEFANRAYAYYLNPCRNPLKERMDRCASVDETPPFLGMFNDIPVHQFRENEVFAWAKAGYSWIVADAEHSQIEGRFGRDQNAILNRLGILGIQRLPREARSEHGDAFQMGARATMRPYGTTVAEAQAYYKSINFPVPGEATPDDRGGYPVRDGQRNMMFTPHELRDSETETQGWIQFETKEYIIDTAIRDQVLELMAAQGPNKACGFVGPFDAILREGNLPEVDDAMHALFRKAADLGVHTGRVVGSGSLDDPKGIEDAMVKAIEAGARIICTHPMTSDMVYRGAAAVAEPFFRAAERCGF